MGEITVHRLLSIDRPVRGPSTIEVELDGTPDVLWIDAFGRHAQATATLFVSGATVLPDTPSVVLTTKEPLSHDNDRDILEWLHDVVAATNADPAAH